VLIGRLLSKRNAPRRPRADDQLHRDRAATQAEVEDRDIDDMLDAIAERRRHAGRRGIGEELADDLLRGTWKRTD
jgi:hypothetical protein